MKEAGLTDWLYAPAIFLVLLVAFRFVVPFLLARVSRIASRTKGKADDAVIVFLRGIPFRAFAFLSLLASACFLPLPPLAMGIVRGTSFVAFTVFAVLLLRRIVEILFVNALPRFRFGSRESLPPVLHVVINLVLWGIALVLILSNLGVNVISLVTGLGIGGIAVALAAQNILGDMFSAFAIMFDQPFREGDFIVVGEHMGTVKQIGIKSTRIQALQGEEIVISNQELTGSRIHNYQRMHERRVPFWIGVTYDTPHTKLARVPMLIKDVIEAAGKTRFDRAHLAKFGDSSLDFEIVYCVLDADYNVFRDIHQAVCLGIVERFEREGIAFAFPTRTVHVQKAE